MSMFTRDKLVGSNGKARTTSLYHETLLPKQNPDYVLFTVGDNPKAGLVNLRSLYVSLCKDDPTEYLFAMTVFGDMELFYKHRNHPVLSTYYDKFQKEADIARKAEAFKTIIEEARAPEGKNRMQASRFLIEEPWKKGTQETSKDKRKARKESRETTELAFEAEGLSEDVKRLAEAMEDADLATPEH